MQVLTHKSHDACKSWWNSWRMIMIYLSFPRSQPLSPPDPNHIKYLELLGYIPGILRQPLGLPSSTLKSLASFYFWFYPFSRWSPSLLPSNACFVLQKHHEPHYAAPKTTRNSNTPFPLFYPPIGIPEPWRQDTDVRPLKMHLRRYTGLDETIYLTVWLRRQGQGEC